MEFAAQLEQARAGDRQALGQLLDRWRGLLQRQARRGMRAGLKRRTDADDVVQQAMLQVVRQLRQFRGTTEAEWVAWLKRIVARQAARLWRRHSAARRSIDREAGVCEHEPAARDRGPLQHLLQAEQRQRLTEAVAELPAAMRAVVDRRVIHGQPFAEVAGRLGRSPGATRVLWTRAVARLRRRLAA